jgi:hypothetical protein
MWKKILQRTMLVVIALLGIKTAIQGFISTIHMSSQDVAIANWDDRLLNLLALVPFDRGFIGYISNADIPGAAFDENDTMAEYVLTQFAAAPIIIIRGTDQEWNILNLEPDAFATWQLANLSDFEIVGSGSGLYLVRKVNK